MSSVKMETRNEGRGQREWDYVCQGEPGAVAKLIRMRGQLDPSFYPGLEAQTITGTNGVFQFSEPITCTYLDLERLIETGGLSCGERFVVNKAMLGYTFLDMEAVYGKSRQTYEKLFARAVAKICRQNDSHWYETYGGK